MRAWEVPVFFGAAIAAHLVAFATIESGEDGAPGGQGGADPVTLAATSAEVGVLVQEWDSPPQLVSTTGSAPFAPALPRPPVLRSLVAEPERADADIPPLAPLGERDMPIPPLAKNSPDIVEPKPAAERPASIQPDPLPSQRKPARPRTETVRPALTEDAPPSAARAELHQSGKPNSAGTGGLGQETEAPSLPRERASLVQIWGARIQQRLQQALAYPRQAEIRGITGRAVVELVVGTDGEVRTRRLTASSGYTFLDRAAVSAVDRAGRLPPAPPGVPGKSVRFKLPVNFRSP